MSERFRIVCSECDKKLVCPASAAGKKVRCSSCGATIRVPDADGAGTPPGDASEKKRRRSSPTAKPSKRRRPADPDFDDDPYQNTVPDSPTGMPPRAGKGRTSARKKTNKSTAGDRHWSKKMQVGFGIMGVAIVSNVIQTAMMGRPNMTTAEGRGQAVGQGLVTVGGLIFGLVIAIRGFQANRAEK
ncbi:MAG: hypothetical protein GY903_19805 [Fuerstiella sp.]|nr:hypothetical protein [Fuerstiella sp.]